MIQLRQPCAVPINCASIFFALAIITRDKIRYFFIPSRFDITSIPPPSCPCLSEPAASSTFYPFYPSVIVRIETTRCNSCREKYRAWTIEMVQAKTVERIYIYIYIFKTLIHNAYDNINRMTAAIVIVIRTAIASDGATLRFSQEETSNPNLYYNARVKCASSARLNTRSGALKFLAVRSRQKEAE